MGTFYLKGNRYRFVFSNCNGISEGMQMKILDQGCYFTSVNKEKHKEILSKTTIVSSKTEATAYLLVDIKTFCIKQAWYEMHKEDRKLNNSKIHMIQELIGVEAYFNIGKVLKDIPDIYSNEIIKVLILECVRGLIQSETYIYMERGFESPRENEDFWKTDQLNSCRYYSNLDKIDVSWYDYIDSDYRENNLFNRYQSYTIIKESDNNIWVRGTFNDSFHEMNIQLSFEMKTGVIKTCMGEMHRAPGAVCFENTVHLDRFVGMKINALTSKDAPKILGGSCGCFHLADIMSKMIFAAQNI